MKRKNGNQDQSQSSSSQSSDRSMKESKEPCEICGSVGIESLLMRCFKCRGTREHTYCARVFLPSVSPIWLCEVCRSSSSCVLLTVDVAKDLTDSESTDCASEPKKSSNFTEKDQKTAKLRSNGVEEVVNTKISSPVILQASTSDSSYEIFENVSSVIHPPSQPHTSTLGDETHLPRTKELANHLTKEASLVSIDTSRDKEQHSPSQAFLKTPNKIRSMGKNLSVTPDTACLLSGSISNRSASPKCKPRTPKLIFKALKVTPDSI